MITKYHNRKKQSIDISSMESDHLINAYDYFRKKRYEWQQKNDRSGDDVLKLSLLIAALKDEIDKRRLFDF